MHIIFDLDGVITSEQTYWNTVSQVLPAILSGSSTDARPLPLSLIATVKGSAVNSNWDLAYLVLCCHFLAQYSRPQTSRSVARATTQAATFEELADCLNARRLDFDEILQTLSVESPVKGFALLERVGDQLDAVVGNAKRVFCYGGPAYQNLHLECQRFHDEKFQSGSPAEKEDPSVDLDQLRELLARLRSGRDVTFGIATGRTRKEAFRALREFGLESFFEPERVVCYDDVAAAEALSKADGVSESLTKPHPYSILRAAYPAESVQRLVARDLEPLAGALYVGDGVSDVLAAKTAGAFAVGVLTGIPDVRDFRTARRQELLDAGCDCILTTVLDIERALLHSRR